MKNNLDDDLNGVNEQQVEDALSKAFVQVMYKNQKTKYSNVLRDKYGVHEKEVPNTRDKKPSANYSMRWLIALIIIAILGGAYYFSTQKNNMSKEIMIVNQYALNDVYKHPGNIKGSNEQDLINAIQSYNTKDYKTALEFFDNASSQTIETKFYSAMCNFYLKKYDVAAEKLSNVSLQKSVYEQEVKWFLGIALILDNKIDQGKKVLETIQPSDWNYEKAQKVLSLKK